MDTATLTPPVAQLSKETIREILTKAEAGWFDIEEHAPENGTATLGSREFGNVGDEEPGEKDIQAARRIRTVIKEQYPDFRSSAECVDEWVMVNIKPGPKTQPQPTIYCCQVCGNETTQPRDGKILGFSAPLICADFCCDGPVTPKG